MTKIFVEIEVPDNNCRGCKFSIQRHRGEARSCFLHGGYILSGKKLPACLDAMSAMECRHMRELGCCAECGE